MKPFSKSACLLSFICLKINVQLFVRFDFDDVSQMRNLFLVFFVWRYIVFDTCPSMLHFSSNIAKLVQLLLFLIKKRWHSLNVVAESLSFVMKSVDQISYILNSDMSWIVCSHVFWMALGKLFEEYISNRLRSRSLIKFHPRLSFSSEKTRKILTVLRLTIQFFCK